MSQDRGAVGPGPVNPDSVVQPRIPQPTRLPQMSREEAFNDVIYALTALHRMVAVTQGEHRRGVEFALEYVKAMAEAEA